RHRSDWRDGRILALRGRESTSPSTLVSASGVNILKEIEARGLKAVRFSFADQHGVLRGKTLAAAEVKAALERGVTVTSTLVLKDTSHRTVFPAFTPGGGVGMAALQGAADVLMIPDPSTFRVLPWAPNTGWMLCDLRFQDGRPMPFCTRTLLKNALKKLRPYEFVSGLEVEFHVFRITDVHHQPADAGQPGTPPDVELLDPKAKLELLSTGYQYLTEQRYDLVAPVVELLRKDLAALAPDRVIWGKENRGAMLRVIGGPGDPGTRIENRIGEPAANPYLYFASQIYSGLDGIGRKLKPPPSADTPYEAKADFLPRTLT